MTHTKKTDNFFYYLFSCWGKPDQIICCASWQLKSRVPVIKDEVGKPGPFLENLAIKIPIDGKNFLSTTFMTGQNTPFVSIYEVVQSKR